MSPRPIALVTGASAGIGAALARVFAANGHHLVLVARSAPELAILADEIAATGKPRPLVMPFDLNRNEASALLSTQLAAKGLEPAIVVNNAGFGLIGAAGDLDRAEQLAMIDLNVRALTDLTLRFLPAVIRHKGGVLNVASVAGFLPGPNMAVYYATKAYVLSFTEAIAAEIAGTGARVTALCPGPVPTKFQVRAGMTGSQLPAFMSQSPEAVAQAGYDGLARGRRVVVPGFANKLVMATASLTPNRLLLPVIKRMQKVRQKPGFAKAARP